ncbi:MAG TPA: hypothetical protein VGG10_15055 [Rhizomicrobium sp.]|jgi:hypothetical protein
MSGAGLPISQLNHATAPLSHEAVVVVQNNETRQADAALFGIPIVATSAPTGLTQFQGWLDSSHSHPIWNLFIGSAWVPIASVDPATGQITLVAPLVLPGSPTADPQAADKAYVDAAVATPLTNSIVIKGALDCSADPNYPAANEGDAYYVSVAGLIGGGSGLAVPADALMVCKTNATGAGTEAAVGASWFVLPSLAAALGLGGDLSGTPNAAAIAKLRGVVLSTDVLAQGQAYAYDAISNSLKARSIEGINYLINPSFDIWQENTTYAVTNAASKTHLADGWKAASQNPGRTISRVAGIDNSEYALKVQRSAANTQPGQVFLVQQLGTAESMALAGKNVVLSFDFTIGANYTPANLFAGLFWGTGLEEDIDLHVAAPNFPTGGTTISAAVTSQIAAFGTVARIITGPMPVPVGATEVAVAIRAGNFQGTAGGDDSYTVANVKLEIANIATHFRKPLIADEMVHCLRRYRKTFLQATVPAQNIGAGNGEFTGMAGKAGAVALSLGTFNFGVPMRIPPVVSFFNPAAANSHVRDLTAAADCSAEAAANITESACQITCTGNASTAVGNVLGVHAVFDARL